MPFQIIRGQYRTLGPYVRYWGIGGTSNVIWLSADDSQDSWQWPTNDKIHELSTVDFSSIRSARPPGPYPYNLPYGIGGDENVIWYCHYYWVYPSYRFRAHELSTTDFSSIKSAYVPAYAGIGGDANTVWLCDNDPKTVYELSTTDFSVIRSASVSVSYPPLGIGGNADHIWLGTWRSWQSGSNIHELSTTDFSVIKEASAPTGYLRGAGGDSDIVWVCDESNHFWELSGKTCGKIEVGDKVILLPIGNMFGNVVALKSFIFREGYSQKAFLPSLDEKVALKLAFRSCRAKTNDKVICLPIEGMKENIVALR